jgi:Ca2+-transporting ATPase
MTATFPSATAPEWYGLAPQAASETLEVEPANGLSAAQVTERVPVLRLTRWPPKKRNPPGNRSSGSTATSCQLVLLGAALVSIIALQDVSTGIVIIALTVFNALMGLHQEGKAAESVAALRKMLIMTASVRRDGQIVEVPAEDLVPGDIVGFEAGDKLPADGRLLVAANLEIEEAGLTGESTPVAKT